jgi:hypothetical protein
MKKKILITGVLMTLLSYSGISQNIKAALIAGTNLSQVDGDEVYGFHRAGLNAGLAAIVPVGGNFYLNLETLYSQKGAYQKQQYAESVRTGEYDLRLNYVEIPVFLQYNDKDILMGGAGFAYSRLLDAIEEENSGNTTPYTETQGFNKDDFSVFADLQFRVYQKFYFNFRYSYSIAMIRERQYDPPAAMDESWKRKQYNNVLSFRLIYRINEKKRTKSEANRSDAGI